MIGYVYFIQRRGDASRVKIGFSENPDRRIKSLQIGSPNPLEIVAVFAGSKQDEATLHDVFSDKSLHGEWFRREGTLDGLIAHLGRFGSKDKVEEYLGVVLPSTGAPEPSSTEEDTGPIAFRPTGELLRRIDGELSTLRETIPGARFTRSDVVRMVLLRALPPSRG